MIVSLEFELVLAEYAWWLLTAGVGYLLSPPIRTVVVITRAELRDRYLRAKGVPEAKRRELLVGVGERDAGSS